MKKKGFTLVEVIVVLSIFGIVGLVSVTTFLTAFRVGQRSTIENALLNDARYIMNTIAAEIQAGTIDYEEYFNQCVLGGSCPHPKAKPKENYEEFGNNHGYYNWQFKYGGTQEPDGRTDGFGSRCQDQLRNYHDYPNVDEDDPLPSPTSTSCITGPLSFSDDIDEGMNPNPSLYLSTDGSDAWALCKNVIQYFTDSTDGIKFLPSIMDTVCDSGDAKNLDSYIVNELYLINEAGDRKTIIIPEYVTSEGDKAISKVEMVKTIQAEHEGKNLPLTAFTCADGYDCSNMSEEFHGEIRYPERLIVPNRLDGYNEDFNQIFKDFVPVSPLRVDVKSLAFIISPIEDPRRAFSETNSNIQMQPQVTILLELEPSSAFKFPFISDNFNLKLQSTVTAGVLKEVPIISDL